MLGQQTITAFQKQRNAIDTLTYGISDILDALTTGTPLDNTSIKLATYGSKNEGEIALKLGFNWISQFVPRLFKTINKTIDPYERDVYSNDAWIQMALQAKMMIPGQSFSIDPKYDIWGQPIKSSRFDGVVGFADRFIMNFISPFATSRATMDATTKEVTRVFEATKNEKASAIPGILSPTFTVDKVDYEVTGKKYLELLQKTGKLYKEEIDKEIKSQYYNVHKNGNLTTDKERAEKFSKIYETVRKDVMDDFKDDEDLELYKKSK
jgi:hypothetical protein